MFSENMLQENNLLLHHQDPRTAISIQRKRAQPDATWHSNCQTTKFLPSSTRTTDCKKTARTSYCNFYKTQSYAFLLIFLCAILFPKSSSAYPVKASGQRLILHSQQYRLRQHQKLLEQQRQLAASSPTPTAHHHHHLHHRSVSNMADPLAENNNNNNVDDYNNISNDFCNNNDHLKNMLEQVNKTYSYIYSQLGEYTNSQYKKTPEEVHVTWLKHMFQLDHPLRDVLERDFYKLPDKESFLHIINKPLTKEMIHNEMQKVYSTLKILQNALEDVIKYRKDNKMQLLHDLHNNHTNFNKIDKFFEAVNTMVNVDMHEVMKFMEKLEIPLPQVNSQNEYHSRTEVRDWLLASEHLSVTQYLRVLYMTLLEKCPQAAE